MRLSLFVRSTFVVALSIASVSGSAQAQLGTPVSLPIAIESAQIEGDFLLNGSSFSTSFFDGGSIEVETRRGEVTFLGQSWNQAYGSARLIQGVYSPRFRTVFAGATSPLANGQRFDATTELFADQIWDLDVPAVQVDFSFLMNGAVFPSGVGEVAEFRLRDTSTGREVVLGSSEDGSVARFIVPGTYEVVYAYETGVVIPRNEQATVLTGLEITSSTTVVVDVPMVGRSFFYFLDGVAFPNAANNYGRFELQTEDGDRVEIGESFSPDFVRLIPGTYRGHFQMQQTSGGVVPLNPNAIFDPAVVIAPSGTATVHLDVVSHLVDPSFLMNGQPPPVDAVNIGHLYLDGGEGDRIFVGESFDDPAPIRIVAGTYDAYYERHEAQGLVPVNPNTRFATGIVIDADAPLVLDFPVATLDLTLLLNGLPFPIAANDYARIWIVDRETQTEVLAGDTFESPFDLLLIQGVYDVIYRVRESAGDVPDNPNHVLAADLVLDSDLVETLDVQSMLVTPSFMLDGASFPPSSADRGELFLRTPRGDDLSLGTTDLVPSNLHLIQGAYTVHYVWRSGDVVPRNSEALVSIASVPEPGFALGLLCGASWLSRVVRSGSRVS